MNTLVSPVSQESTNPLYPDEFILENRPIKDLIKELNLRIMPILNEVGEGWIGCVDYSGSVVMPPVWRWLSCFVVQGGSEGYYIHVEVIHRTLSDKDEGSRQMLGLLKVWSWESAFKIADAATRVLHGYPPT